jgi:hypothetical protein
LGIFVLDRRQDLRYALSAVGFARKNAQVFDAAVKILLLSQVFEGKFSQ